MVIEEIKSRIFRIRGNGTLEAAYGDYEDTQKSNDGCSVEKGKCLYLVRLELAPEGHPEINDDKFYLEVKTTRYGMTYSKGLGGARRGWQGEEIPFEQLVEQAQFPNDRTNNAVNREVRDALVDILRGYHYNCNFRIFSEFDGYYNGFGARFDKERTYMPVIKQAVKEIQTNL